MRLGITFGEPAGPGKPALCLLYGSGSPSSQVVDPTVMNVSSCSVGSLYSDFTAGALYVKTGVATQTNVNGVWSQLS